MLKKTRRSKKCKKNQTEKPDGVKKQTEKKTRRSKMCSETMQRAAKRYTYVFCDFLKSPLAYIILIASIGTSIALAIGMAYIPRYKIIYDNAHFHVTWQCHNKKWLLRHEWVKAAYYNLLLKYKDKYGVEIYSYNFMDNHPHLTGHLREKEKFSGFFRVVNGQFAKLVNKKLKRHGQVVMDRFKSPVIESDEHMLKAMAYIDLNQHRVGKVPHPSENTWSSYGYYAFGNHDPLITPSPSYLALGRNAKERRCEYVAMVEALMRHRKLMNISHAYFIGNPEWVVKKYRELCSNLGRRASKAKVTRLSAPT